MCQQNVTHSIETIGSWEESPECECPEPGFLLRLQTRCMTVANSCPRCFQRGKWFKCDFPVSDTLETVMGERFREEVKQ